MEEEKKKTDQEILKEFSSIYSAEMKKFETCENILVGNFNENNEYKILDIVNRELIKLQKVIEYKDEKEYRATANVNKVKLNFIVSIEILPENKVSATLKLVENMVVAKMYKSTITTQLSKFIDNGSDNFLFKVRKAFHLVSKDELNGKVDIRDYVAPPIELYTELKKKHEFYEKMIFEREQKDKAYITAVLNILRKSKNGNLILKKFVGIIKDKNLDKDKSNNIFIFRHILDKVIEEETLQNNLDISDCIKIKEARILYLEEIKEAHTTHDKNNETILGKVTPKSKSAAKSSSSKKNGGSSSDGGSKSKGGGGKSGGGGDKKDSGKKKDKDDSLFNKEYLEGIKEAKPEKENPVKPVKAKVQVKKAKILEEPEPEPENNNLYKKLDDLSKIILNPENQQEVLKETAKETISITTVTDSTQIEIESINTILKENSQNIQPSQVLENEGENLSKKFLDLKKLVKSEPEQSQ